MNDMNISAETIQINGVAYVRADSVKAPEPRGPASIIRTKNAGVFFGYVKSRSVQGEYPSFVVDHCRRIWSWKGAKTISEIATNGLDIAGSNVAVPTDNHEVNGVLENVPCTAKAEACLRGAKWII
jgi:hypothetical protein